MSKLTLRILFCLPNLSIGGLETKCIRLANASVAEGYSVTVLCSAEPGERAAQLDPAVEVVSLHHQGSFLKGGWGKLGRALRRLKPHIYHGFSNVGGVHGVHLARAAGVRVVVASCGNDAWCEPLGDYLMMQLAYPRASVVHANSEGVRRAAIARWRLNPARVVNIPNPFDPDPPLAGEAAIEQRQAVRAELGVRDDDLLFATVARFRPQKDYLGLVEAVGRAANQLPRGHWVLVGDGSERAKVERRIAELGLGDRVTRLGARFDVPRLWPAFDVFVLPSLYEGLPNALEEAMGAGLPAIGTRVCGTDELIVPGETGWLVPKADPAALAAAFLEADGVGEEQRAQLGAAGRQRIAEHYANPVVLPQYFRMYRNLWRSQGRSAT